MCPTSKLLGSAPNKSKLDTIVGRSPSKYHRINHPTSWLILLFDRWIELGWRVYQFNPKPGGVEATSSFPPEELKTNVSVAKYTTIYSIDAKFWSHY